MSFSFPNFVFLIPLARCLESQWQAQRVEETKNLEFQRFPRTLGLIIPPFYIRAYCRGSVKIPVGGRGSMIRISADNDLTADLTTTSTAENLKRVRQTDER